MRILSVLAMVLALLVTIFAVQNNAVTAIKFLFWSVEGSAALVLMITLFLGIIIGALLMTPGSVRNRLRIHELRRKVEALQGQVSSLGSLAPQPPPATPERPEAIDN